MAAFKNRQIQSKPVHKIAIIQNVCKFFLTLASKIQTVFR